jgi:VIT1/CCC1 family predicted Fe2+/Mn2+ transporter
MSTSEQRHEGATAVSDEVRSRLLHAWHGEIQAGATYALIARRLPEREAIIVQEMADAEGGHRDRLEARMRELGIAVPDVSSVKLSWWARLQARLAPVDRLLAAREAAEDDEVDDTYKKPTGDKNTDQLLRDIRKEERSHSMAVGDIRTGDGGVSVPTPAALTPVQQQAKAKLDKIIGREGWHRTGSGWISGAIYGANDGLAAVFGIVAGVAGATGGSSFVLTAGIAGAIASALSMATGAFLAERSEAEVAAVNVERERQEIAERPEEEKQELSLFYQLKGIDQATADAMAEQLASQPDAMLRALSVEEFGGMGDRGNPAQSALAAGVSTGLGAMVPVIPFIFIDGTWGVVIAAGVSLIAHFLVGAAKSLFTLRTWWAAGLEMTLAGVIVGGATFAVGLALPT